MLKRGSVHLRALSMNEVPSKGPKTPRSSLLKSRGDTSLCVDVQKNSALMTTTDTEDTISTRITRNKISFRNLISQRTSKRHQSNKPSYSNKTTAPVTPVLGVRNIFLPSFQSQKQGDAKTPTWKDISDFSQFQTINYGLAFLERKRMFEAAKIKEKRFYSQNRQANPIPKNLKQLQKNLFKINKSKKNFDDRPKEMLCPPQEDTRTISSFHREQSISALSPSRTNIFDSARASSSRGTSADLSDRLKEIDDLNEMVGDLEIMKVHTEYNYDLAVEEVQERKVLKKSKRKLDYLQTESSCVPKQYLNLGQLLDTEESAVANVNNNNVLPKIFLTNANTTMTTTTTPKVCFNSTIRDVDREHFKKMIYKGIGRDPQCRMDPSLLIKMNQDRATFEKRLRRLVPKN